MSCVDKYTFLFLTCIIYLLCIIQILDPLQAIVWPLAASWPALVGISLLVLECPLPKSSVLVKQQVSLPFAPVKSHTYLIAGAE